MGAFHGARRSRKCSILRWRGLQWFSTMRRALVVDDEAPIRNLLAAVLRRERIPTDTAANGSEALELIEKNEYACVVLDLMMPILTGRDVIDAMLHYRVR